MHVKLALSLRVVLLVSVAVTLPLGLEAKQDPSSRPQTRPAPPQPPNGGGSQPSRPGPGSGGPPSRPGSGGPGSGGPQIQPVRPNPGRPQIQPVRPNPGRPQIQPVRPNPGVRPPPRPNPGYRPPRPGRPPQWGRPPQNRPSWHFRPRDRDYLRRHYLRHLAYINLARRPVFTVGGYFPYGDIGYLTPVPADLWGSMPPIPPGYQAGYFDGYVVIYDPVSYFILDLIDLVQ